MVHVKLPAQQNAMRYVAPALFDAYGLILPSSRARFMIETLTNLKNNKVKKDAGVSAATGAVDRLKKFLTALGKKRQGVSLLSFSPLYRFDVHFRSESPRAFARYT